MYDVAIRQIYKISSRPSTPRRYQTAVSHRAYPTKPAGAARQPRSVSATSRRQNTVSDIGSSALRTPALLVAKTCTPGSRRRSGDRQIACGETCLPLFGCAVWLREARYLLFRPMSCLEQATSPKQQHRLLHWLSRAISDVADMGFGIAVGAYSEAADVLQYHRECDAIETGRYRGRCAWSIPKNVSYDTKSTLLSVNDTVASHLAAEDFAKHLRAVSRRK